MSNETYNLSWNVHSILNGSFSIYQNGSLIDQGTWKDGDIISVSGGPLTPGYYNFTISITTTNGTSVSYTVFVTVLDPAFPITSTTSTSISSIISTSSSLTEVTNNTSSSGSGSAFLPGFTYSLLIVSMFTAIIVKRKRTSLSS